MKDGKAGEINLILVDIRSAHNVGSIFRTADAAGVQKIFLSGYTPAPKDRFDRERNDIAKVALGAEKTVAWEQVEKVETLIKKLKKEGVTVIAIEQSDDSILYKDIYKNISREKEIALIFGNETEGVPKKILDMCDYVAEIPMKGIKESLNVSVSVGIVLFGLI